MSPDKDFYDLVELMRKLRDKDGCPWDREQTHESLKPYLVEETYEVIDAIDSKDAVRLKEELGDLLFQVLFHSQIAREEGEFDIADVIRACLEKMTSRHPHVFGEERLKTAEEVIKVWHQIKVAEGKEASVLGSLPRHLPALQKAQKVQKKASRVGFDWERVEDVIAKIEEELGEVKEAMAQGRQEEVEEEVGDLLFAAANLSRFLKINPEEALHKTIEKFVDRFKRVEAQLASRGKDIEHCTLEEMDMIWESIKRGG